MLWALEAGYRLVDTAAAYGNESEVGEAFRASGLPRGEVFITTKVWPAEFGYEATLRAFEASRLSLGLEQVDLYLLHWPGDDRRRRAESWRALETLLGDGRCRAVGVSNYAVAELEEILERRPTAASSRPSTRSRSAPSISRGTSTLSASGTGSVSKATAR